ncbi:hypothetical protein BDV10DRAFT_173227 [Aspergillus recurvatus]
MREVWSGRVGGLASQKGAKPRTVGQLAGWLCGAEIINHQIGSLTGTGSPQGYARCVSLAQLNFPSGVGPTQLHHYQNPVRPVPGRPARRRALIGRLDAGKLVGPIAPSRKRGRTAGLVLTRFAAGLRRAFWGRAAEVEWGRTKTRERKNRARNSQNCSWHIPIYPVYAEYLV